LAILRLYVSAPIIGVRVIDRSWPEVRTESSSTVRRPTRPTPTRSPNAAPAARFNGRFGQSGACGGIAGSTIRSVTGGVWMGGTGGVWMGATGGVWMGTGGCSSSWTSLTIPAAAAFAMSAARVGDSSVAVIVSTTVSSAATAESFCLTSLAERGRPSCVTTSWPTRSPLASSWYDCTRCSASSASSRAEDASSSVICHATYIRTCAEYELGW
jgi:hypothetical protein